MTGADDPAANLEVRALCGVRGALRLFEDLSFRVERGEALIVFGPNGSGKTTLLRILAGLSRAAAGSIQWRGVEGSPWSADQRRELLYLGHTVPVRAELSVIENLTDQLARDGVRRPLEVRLEALEAVGLLERRLLPARHLSLGQRRRLGLARVQLADRPLWLLDEPTTGLDQAGITLLEGILARHLDAGGLTVLSSHQALRLPKPARTLTL